MKKMFPDWFFCFYKHVCTCFIWHYRTRKAKSIPEVSFSPFAGRSKHSGIEAGKRSLFKPIYLFRRLGTKLWLISHSPQYFSELLKVRLINMALIAEVCWKRVRLLSDDSSSKWSRPISQIAQNQKFSTPLLRYLQFFSSFRLERLILKVWKLGLVKERITTESLSYHRCLSWKSFWKKAWISYLKDLMKIQVLLLGVTYDISPLFSQP